MFRVLTRFLRCRFVSTTMTTVGYGVYTPDDALGRMFAMMAAFAAMLLLAMMSAILAKFVELKYNEAVGIGWSSRQDRQSAFTSAAAKLIQVSYRLSLTGRLRWSARRKLASHEAAEFAMAIARFKKMRIKIDESKVQGDGGYLIVMERIASAQEDIHVQMDACEKKLDASIDSIMSNIMYQLTKMEEMQGMVLDANFETIRNNIVKIDKRMRQINKGHAVDDGDDN